MVPPSDDWLREHGYDPDYIHFHDIAYPKGSRMAFWQRLNDKTTTLGRAWRTFYQAFLALFLFTLVGWLGDVVTWAQCVEACQAFPQLTVLGKAAVAGIASAGIALVSFLQNAVESPPEV